MRLFIVFLISYFLFLISPSLMDAADISVYPAYQDILASNSAYVAYTNHSHTSIDLTFSLQQIIATDLLGRLKFNAPLPQTLQTPDPQIAIINPNQLLLNPGETGTISATFNPAKLDPGTTAFLLLAKINYDSSLLKRGTPESGGELSSTFINQYLGSSILVTALGSHTTRLELLKTSLSPFPVRFSHPDFIQLTLRNSGNTRSIPRGVVQIFDLFGREIMRGPINRDSVAILPNSQRLIYTHLQPSHFTWPITLAHLKLAGSDDVGASHFTHSFIYLYLHPLVFPALAFIWITFLILKKHKKKS